MQPAQIGRNRFSQFCGAIVVAVEGLPIPDRSYRSLADIVWRYPIAFAKPEPLNVRAAEPGIRHLANARQPEFLNRASARWRNITSHLEFPRPWPSANP